jgi:hypothetical protein
MEGENHEECGDCDSDCGVSATVKRARTPENESTTHPVHSPDDPKFFLVVLSDVYGSTDNYPAFYACWSKLTPEQRKALFRSIPSSRAGAIPGCEENHDFGEGVDDQGVDHILEGNIWKCIEKDKDLSAFTRANHCEVTVAYFSE